MGPSISRVSRARRSEGNETKTLTQSSTEKCTHTSLQTVHICEGPITNLFSILCIENAQVLSRAHAKGVCGGVWGRGGGREGGGGALIISTLALLPVVFRMTAQQAWQ